VYPKVPYYLHEKNKKQKIKNKQKQQQQQQQQQQKTGLCKQRKRWEMADRTGIIYGKQQPTAVMLIVS